MIWVVSTLIIIFMYISVSPEFRHKIRQFIGDDTSDYYHQTINLSDSDSIAIEIVTHTIIKVNNSFIGHSKQMNEVIVINSEMDLSPYVNPYTQNCSSCHQEIQ